MANKEVAVTGCTLQYDAPVTGSVPTFVTPASTKVKAESNGVYMDGATITIPSGITDGTCTSTAPVTADIPATAVKVKVEGSAPLRVDDQVTKSGIVGVTSSNSACTLTATVKITNAGQTKVKAG